MCGVRDRQTDRQTDRPTDRDRGHSRDLKLCVWRGRGGD